MWLGLVDHITPDSDHCYERLALPAILPHIATFSNELATQHGQILKLDKYLPSRWLQMLQTNSSALYIPILK